jgi:hypothetical protein
MSKTARRCAFSAARSGQRLAILPWRSNLAVATGTNPFVRSRDVGRKNLMPDKRTDALIRSRKRAGEFPRAN